MAQRILVTGASGGFGKLTVNALLDRGHTVIGSLRGANGKNKEAAEELSKAGAHIVEIDVTNESSVNAGVEKAISLAGGLDVVVNNAGLGVMGLQEGFTTDDWSRVFDINVFGVQRMNRAALPHLREQGSGLLVHISSLLGRMVLPFYGPYNASKWALEALAENYRYELSGLGVDSVLIEPGGYPTNFMHGLVTPSDDRAAAYGDLAGGPKMLYDNFGQALEANPAQDPQNVANAIADVIETPAGNRPFRTTVDKMGMGDHIGPYNEQLEQITKGVYSAFGLEGMMELKEKANA